MLATGGLFIFRLETIGILLVGVILLTILIFGIKINRSDILIACFLLLLLIHSLILLEPNEPLIHIWRRFSLFFVSYLIYITNKDSDEILNNLVTVLKIPLFVTLITLTLVMVPGGRNLFTKVDYYYSFLYIFNYMLYEPLVFPRIMGLFFEPGVNQIYLNLLLYISLFQRPNRKYSALATIAVLSTASTTGYLVLAIIWLAYIWVNWWHISLKYRLVVLLLNLLIIPLTLSNVSNKFHGSGKGSFEARNVDLTIGLKILYNNPIFGIGFNYDKYYQQGNIFINQIKTEVVRFRGPYERGSSNSVIRLLFSLGIILSIPFLLGLYYQDIFRDRLLIFVILILCLSSEALLLFPFFLMIIYKGMGLFYYRIFKHN